MSFSLRKALAAGIAAAMAAILMAGCGGDGDKSAEKKFINIATGGTAGTYYPIGAAIAEVLNKDIPGMNASAQSTGASVANVNMLRDHQVELGILQNDIAYYADNGTEMFAGKAVKGMQGIATLYPETCQFVVLESSGIRSIADLRGKRVAVGAAGSSAEANARQILATYGISYDDIAPQFLSFAEGAGALKSGKVDATFLTAGYPTASVQDIASQNRIRILSLEADKARALLAKYPYYINATIPAGTYQGFDEPADSVSVMAMLVASDQVDEKLGYEIAKAVFTNLDRIQAAHPAGKLITKKGARDGMPIEMNPGAVKFFKE